MDEVEVTIIGAGVIGLSIAASLSKKHKNIILLERHDTFGQEISSRNSEVLHAGIYYPANSLKARMCVEGIEKLYPYCEEHSIPYAKPGKLIVATEESELPQLEELNARAQKNGVSGLSVIDRKDIKKIEPNVTARAAIYSPNTGIIDTHSLMKQLYNEADSRGVLFSFKSDVYLIKRERGGYVIGIRGESYRFVSRVIINAAGLSSDDIASIAGIDVDAAGYRLSYCKGSYFSYAKKSPVHMLVYPLPDRNLSGLGVHATLDLGGRLRFGPDTEYIDTIDYTIDSTKRDYFYEGASKFIHDLDREALIPDMVGIRPKIKGEGIKDFIIRNEVDRDLEGFINLIGIESPGLTSALSIAEYVGELVTDTLN